MEDKIDEILKTVKLVESRVNDLWKFNNMDSYREFPPLLHSKSPVQLTTLGENILKQYKGQYYVDKLEADLIEEIDKRGFKSPLDVQEFCERIVMSKFNTDELLEIKNLIYHTPMHETHPVTVKSMSLVMGLYLRNKYFEKHPEMIEAPVA
jgi:hypothetical protein